jgi:hypothetical protein
MTLPGDNTLTLNNAAIMRIIQEKLNADLSTSAAIVRVTKMKSTTYGDSTEFTITTDKLETPQPTKETL